jgi:hypothetical protein
MNTLFDTSEFKVKIEPKIKVKVMVQKHKKLSKNQITFNDLIKKIERLQKEIVSDKEKLDRLLIFYDELNIATIEKDVAECQIKIAKRIASTTKTNKYGKRQLENIGTVIIDLLDNASIVLKADEEVEKLYAEYANKADIEEDFPSTNQKSEEMEALMRHIMGEDFVFFFDFDDSSESFEHYQDTLHEEISNKKAGSKKEWKKTKKQLKRELQLAEEEKLKLKNIRSIYISVAKVLHPDTESDHVEKLLKEELMKKLTVAYKKKDLSTLLKLEMEWVTAKCLDVDKMSDEKLQLYISWLKDQVTELEDEIYSLYNHPRYEPIEEFARDSESTANRFLNKYALRIQNEKKALEALIATFSKANPKKEIMSYVNKSVKKFNFDPFDIYDNHVR